MKIYIASFFDTKERLFPIRDRLRAMGHEVTSTWLNEKPWESGVENWPAHARRDLEAIDRSDAIIVDTFDVTPRGGREVELGYFFGTKGTVMASVVGPLRNVFHHLVGAHFENWEDCLIAFTPAPVTLDDSPRPEPFGTGEHY